MKKLFTLLLLATSIVCFGQNKDFLKEVSSINFYGVDYSAAKVFGAAESPNQLINAFERINELFITEAKKYDVSKKLKIKVGQISLNAVNKVNSEIDPAQLMTTDTGYTLSDKDIKRVIANLPIQQEPGIGLVIVAKLLNKADAYGSYQVVFFNTETKEIINDYATGGKAKGFGLRNYWAGSIHKVVDRL
ncbi:hypothetical protein [Bacteroides sp.]|uniref:hypothetical protein n=1 Tax=Bacteroides sp. TaxID=29523 RepID=UPI002611952C|nr:hypothetical protein [Bacteroides sp.]